MSFSGKVKEELSQQLPTARHCQIAELAAILSFCGSVIIDSREQFSIKIHTENIAVARKCFTLIEKTFNIETENADSQKSGKREYDLFRCCEKPYRCSQNSSGSEAS